MNDRPMFCQIDDSDTANMARSGLVSQSTRNTPTTGWSRYKKITDVTATELASVDAKMAWNALIPRSRRWAATASRMPSSRPAGTV